MDDSTGNATSAKIHGLFIGLDLGTSGCRAIAIDQEQQVAAESAVLFPATAPQEPGLWWNSSRQVLCSLAEKIDVRRVRAIAVDGTSATLLLTDEECRPLGPVMMYNDARGVDEAARIAGIAPPASGAHGATSSLAKLLYMLQRSEPRQACHALHQCDWITSQLSGHCAISDENNCLKLGYDVINRRWPEWLDKLPLNRRLLPRVLEPGSRLGPLSGAVAAELGLPPATQVISGTTDGVAAFLATGAGQVGDAVTSLGSTLVIKVFSDTPVFAPEYGVYSHRLRDRWLVGGASNCGGATLLKYFSREQLERMTPRLRPEQPTGLDYYPLPGVGERFPISDAGKQPLLSPRPADDVMFFQAMLEGMAWVEAQAYALLARLGAPMVKTVRTVGGGAGNQAWQQIRQQRIAAEFLPTRHLQAAYGTALLAQAAGGKSPLRC